MAVVVFPTPPFWLTRAWMRVIQFTISDTCMICHEMPKHFDAKAFQKSCAVQVFTIFDLFGGRVVPHVLGGTYTCTSTQVQVSRPPEPENSCFNTGIDT